MTTKHFPIFFATIALTAWCFCPSLSAGATQDQSGYISGGNIPSANISSSNITSGNIPSANIGEDTRNEIALRNTWVEKLSECDNYVANYIRNTPIPTYLVYSTELEAGEIDWNRETRAINFRIALYPDKNWPTPLKNKMNAVYADFAATGKASVWKIEWPTRAVSGGESPIKAEVNREYLAAVELLNERGQVIGTQSVALQAGWKTNFTGPNAPRANNQALSINTAMHESNTTAASVQTVKIVTFRYVEADKITSRFSIRIARLNGRSAETEAKANAVSIMTEAAYAPVFERQLNMTNVKGGTFRMGGDDKDEQPRRRVNVAGFNMGKYEVTAGEYRAFLISTGQKTGDGILHENDTNPISVNWYDAVKYCNWLSEMTGRRPAYTITTPTRQRPSEVTWNAASNGYRLPTEAEWEYACRAGTTTAYSFGNSISPSQAWYDDRSGRGSFPAPVGSFAPNPWGFYDMHGNIDEWCWDDNNNNYRAVRGGGHLLWGEYLRSAFRNWSRPDSGAGFRILCSSRS
jgi:formylglycine-generating enzyme required for sulfatase activity